MTILTEKYLAACQAIDRGEKIQVRGDDLRWHDWNNDGCLKYPSITLWTDYQLKPKQKISFRLALMSGPNGPYVEVHNEGDHKRLQVRCNFIEWLYGPETLELS